MLDPETKEYYLNLITLSENINSKYYLNLIDKESKQLKYPIVITPKFKRPRIDRLISIKINVLDIRI